MGLARKPVLWKQQALPRCGLLPRRIQAPGSLGHPAEPSASVLVQRGMEPCLHREALPAQIPPVPDQQPPQCREEQGLIPCTFRRLCELAWLTPSPSNLSWAMAVASLSCLPCHTRGQGDLGALSGRAGGPWSEAHLHLSGCSAWRGDFPLWPQSSWLALEDLRLLMAMQLCVLPGLQFRGHPPCRELPGLPAERRLRPQGTPLKELAPCLLGDGTWWKGWQRKRGNKSPSAPCGDPGPPPPSNPPSSAGLGSGPTWWPHCGVHH